MTPGEKVGILGGAFDPVHNGHLAMARESGALVGLGRTVFVPAAVSPYKDGTPAAEGADRLAMLRQATAENPDWTVSEIELDRGGISYTIDTIRRLRSDFGSGPEFYLIIGMDNFIQLAGWKEIEAVVELARFVVVNRPGCDPGRISGQNRYWAERIRSAGRLTAVELSVPISSSQIRRLLREGKDARPFLPSAVAEYIEEHQLYRNG